MSYHPQLPPFLRSLPSRERGLKLDHNLQGLNVCLSLPSRERGLKLKTASLVCSIIIVAPLAGAWIETEYVIPMNGDPLGRSPRGSVD